MHLYVKKPNSAFIAFVAVFAAFIIVCDSLVVPPILPYSGVWHSWIFISEPITGIVLGPLIGFFSNLIGVMLGHSINFVDFYEFLFTVGAPAGATISAFVFRGKWKTAILYYSIMLASLLAAPVMWQLPFWGMWNVYLAFLLLIATALATTKWKGLWNAKSKTRLVYILALSAFIGLEADVLFRIFILIPCQTYQLFYGWDVTVLQALWAEGAIETPIKAAISTAITALIGPPVIGVARRGGLPL